MERLRGRFERWRGAPVEAKPEQKLDTQTAIRPPGNQERAGPELDARIEQGRQAFRDRYEAFRRSREPAVVPEPPAKEKVLEQEKTFEKKHEQELEIKRDRGFGHSR